MTQITQNSPEFIEYQSDFGTDGTWENFLHDECFFCCMTGQYYLTKYGAETDDGSWCLADLVDEANQEMYEGQFEYDGSYAGWTDEQQFGTISI